MKANGENKKVMEKLCILANIEKDKNYEIAEYIKQLIEKSGKKCIMVNDRFTKHKKKGYIHFKEIPTDVECLLTLGGDGTMLQAARDFCHMQIPLLGVNLGTLGFLTEVERQNIEEVLKEIFEGNYKIEHRMMLEGVKEENTKVSHKKIALNDFVLHKSNGRRLVTFHVYVNGELVDTYICDGLIFSTPTGSTAYNLAAGGPVLTPEMKAIIITPICPHSLNKRSLVLSASDKIIVEIGKSKESMDDYAVVNVDGSNVLDLMTGEKIQIQCCKQETKIIRLPSGSFYNRLREKLNRGV